MATIEEILATFEPTSCVTKPNNIGATSLEMLSLYQEAFPYSYISTITGDCLQWNEDFILKCQDAMSTDSLVTFSDIEEQTWLEFVSFEDLKSSSADTDLGVVGAIGCTIPDSLGRSFVVTANGIRYDVECLDPQNSISKERQSYSLDQVFMDIYNCLDYNDCGIKTGDLVDVSPCPTELVLVG